MLFTYTTKKGTFLLFLNEFSELLLRKEFVPAKNTIYHMREFTTFLKGYSAPSKDLFPIRKISIDAEEELHAIFTTRANFFFIAFASKDVSIFIDLFA